ncbi:hypothetical protein GFS24_16620 [Chitinophaga sp. SYP-B3965]|uniref:DUF6624 domain-containing protein n=1 Tax=Chitinophaga sp. SYP-B3965 TaxID=2663120 RepID=UPI0012995CD4|nr:DUF6624 domain-containing protein [Chitinophaga sp. SYP-B3965]MRG46746.1 hypothetical protein [Chitinophaga sp. SYP-B3965]
MKAISLSLLTFLISLSSFAQKDTALARALDSIYISDQSLRKIYGRQPAMDSFASANDVPKGMVYPALDAEIATIDSRNMRFIRSVIKKQGYPGKSLVGERASTVAVSVMLHSNKVKAYLPLLKAAAESGELAFRSYAVALDYYLMHKGEEQVYGTQFGWVKFKKGGGGTIIWPVKDPEGVNERRGKAGFTSTVEQSATQMSIDYKVYQLSDLEKQAKVKKPIYTPYIRR